MSVELTYEWHNAENETPPYGVTVEVRQGDEELFEARYMETTCCMLGPRAGSHGEGFEDTYNGLACPDVTHWRYCDES